LSSASRISHASALHALQSKSHAMKGPADDSFADMLAGADAAPQAVGKQAGKAGGEREQNDKDDGENQAAELKAATPVAANAPLVAGDGDEDQAAADATGADILNGDKPVAAKPAEKSADKPADLAPGNDNNTQTQPVALPAPAALPAGQFALAAPTPAPTPAPTNDNEASDADASQANVPAPVTAAGGAQLPAPQAADAPEENQAPAATGTAPAKAAKPSGFQDLLAAEKSASNAPGNTAKNDDGTRIPGQPADPAPTTPVPAPSHEAPPQPGSNNSAAAAPALPATPANHPAPAAAAAPPHPAAAAHTPDVNGLAVAIFARSQGGARQFDIRLDPPELGRVEVRLSIDNAGKAQAHLTADQPDTLNLLKQDAPALARALRDAGLDVNQDGLNFSLRNQQQQADNGQQNRGQARTPFSRLAPASSIAATGDQPARALGLLDIRV
jgi:chemotaxis protein MotD